MTDDREPKELERQYMKDAYKFLKTKKEAAYYIERVLVKRWGEEVGGDFSHDIILAYPGIIDSVLNDVNLAFMDAQPTINQHTNRNRGRIAMRIVTLLYFRTFLAHIVNRVKDVKETPENFHDEFYKIMPYLAKAMREEPELYEFYELSLYNNLSLNEVVSLWDKKEAAGPASQMILDAIRAADTEEKAKRSLDLFGLKEATYKPIYNGNLTNGLMRLSKRDFEPDRRGKNAYYEAPNGSKYSISEFDKLIGALGVSTKKLLDTATAALTEQNFFRTQNINPTVHIPLVIYGERNGYKLTPETKATPEEQKKENERVRQRVKEFRLKCKSDLLDLEKIACTAEETSGRNAGEYSRMGLITKSHSVRQGVITINFDPVAARYLVNGGVMWLPLVLLSVDNRKNNTYSIGRKIALQNSIDNNFFAGTDCTLSVKSLLSAAPEIPTRQELEDSGNRNWKAKIKGVLEKSLNELVELYPIITKWEYRNPKTGETYTAEQAQSITWEVYYSLMVDWVLSYTIPEQQERRAKKLEERQKAAAEGAKKGPIKKRGRPKKAADKKEK